MEQLAEPISHFFYSHRLKLQFWDWGENSKPPLLLVHGGLDHARNWDWVARALKDDFHVYALDLRGHGNSAWAPGALYGLAEHVLDISALADIINNFPIYIIGHSLGGYVSLHYTGIYPDRVKKISVIEGLGLPFNYHYDKPASERLRTWVETTRAGEKREGRSYTSLDAAVARMKEANPHLSKDVAQHLTLHGTNWNSDGSLVWKFDNYARIIPPYGSDSADLKEVLGQITCPVQLFWGTESFVANPEDMGLAQQIKNYQLVKVPHAGHWLHHDQLQLFLSETKRFLLDS